MNDFTMLIVILYNPFIVQLLEKMNGDGILE